MTQKDTPGKRFRTAVQAEQPLQVVGVINAYCALLAEREEIEAARHGKGAREAGGEKEGDPARDFDAAGRQTPDQPEVDAGSFAQARQRRHEDDRCGREGVEDHAGQQQVRR